VSHVIIRGANGRRHEVDFGDAETTVSLHASAPAGTEVFVAEALSPLQDPDAPIVGEKCQLTHTALCRIRAASRH
jgi:hypothetical protein